MLLEKNKIKLRSPELEDLDFLFQMENDTSLWHLSNTISPFSRFDLEQYILLAEKDIFTAKQLRFIIEYNNLETIGIVDLFDFDPINKRAGVGIIIKENDQNKGYATTALEILFDYSNLKLGLHQLFCNIESDNATSIRLFEKKGFEIAGLKKDWNFKDSVWVDELFLQKIF
jgi:diamine N-acetyltransferase